MSETDEKVLCVDRIVVNTMLGLPICDELRLQGLLQHKTYRNRNTPNEDGPDVEHDDRYKQLIPYIVVLNSSGQILAYNRGSKGGEKRLKGKWAIGFGGHVNDGDKSFEAGIHREIVEELAGIECIFPVPPCFLKDKGDNDAFLHGPIGFINDDSNDVGRKHLGVVYVLRADEVVPREVPEWYWQDADRHLVDGNSIPVVYESWAVLALPMVRAWIAENN